MSAVLGVPVVATLAEDPDSAAVFAIGEPPRHGFASAALMTSTRQAIEQLQRLLTRRAGMSVPAAAAPVPASGGGR